MDIQTDIIRLLDDIVSKIKRTDLTKYTGSIIISGSFGRNEPTYHIEEGKIVYDSDMEMVLAYRNWRDMIFIKQHSAEVIKCFPEIKLELLPISAGRLKNTRNHNYSLLSSKKKTLFTFDFYNGSRTIWGTEYLNSQVSINDVDSFEGKRIIANRVAELTYVRQHHSSAEEENRWLAKIILAVGTAFLIEKREYKSSYHEQQLKIKANQSIRSIFDDNFLPLYTSAFKYLREGEGSVRFGDYEKNIKKYVTVAYDYYKDKDIHKSNTNCAYITIREAMLLLKYDIRYYRYILNPKELILDNVLLSYINNSDDIVQWAEMWHKILN